MEDSMNTRNSCNKNFAFLLTVFLDTRDTAHVYNHHSVVCIALKQSGSVCTYMHDHVCRLGPCHGKAQTDCVWAKWTTGGGGGGGLTLSASCMPLGLR